MDFHLKHPYTDHLHLEVKESVDCYHFMVFDFHGNKVENFKCKSFIVHNLSLPTPYAGERLWAVQAFRQFGKKNFPELFK